MPHPLRAVAFDLDAASLFSLRKALPEWEFEVVNGATPASLSPRWNPAAADFLIVKARANSAETLGLCRFLTSCNSFTTDCQEDAVGSLEPYGSLRNPAPQTDAPLLVLVPPGQEDLVRAVLAAGAHGCLALPLYAKEVVTMLASARAGNQPGHHTLNLGQAQREDPWRDDGGQG